MLTVPREGGQTAVASTRTLSVAMFTETFVPHANGVTTSILNARRGLFARGHKVTVYSAGEPVVQSEPVHYYGGKVFPLYPDFPVAMLPSKLGRHNNAMLAKQQPDLIHIHAPGPMGVRGFRAARRHKLPFVTTYHTVLEPLERYAPFGAKLFYRVGTQAVDRLLNIGCDVLIAPTHAIKRELVRKLPDQEEKIRVVPTGIDVESFRPGIDGSAMRSEWGITPAERVVLYLGRLSYEKRVDVLLHAFHRIRSQQPDLRLVLGGTGPARAYLEGLTRRLGLERAVRFVGHVPDARMAECYNAADVFATASEIETQGLTLVEAMACGVPTAAAAAGGFLDIVRDGQNGYLFARGSVDAAAQGIELALRAGPGLRARARASALEYGVDRCITLLERAYLDAIEAHRSKA